MKRAADREDMPRSLPPGTATRTQSFLGSWPPEGRTSPNGRDLDSLADPVPGPKAISLDEALRSTVKAEAHLELAAKAIRQLDLKDDVQPFSAKTCQDASELLLRLGQARLLCRLATLNPMRYGLAVDPTSHKGVTLASIGSDWPRDAPVSLHLSANCRAQSYVDLREFLMRPEVLDIDLHRDGVSANHRGDEQALAALGETMRPLRLSTLKLNGGACRATVVVHLAGVTARVVVASPKSRPLVTEDEDALVALVSKSGAQELDISHAPFSTKLSVNLLSCNASWKRVAVRSTDGFMAWQKKGQGCIGQLELRGDANVCWRFNADVFKALHRAGAQAFRVTGAVLLIDAMDAMQRCARESHAARLLVTFGGTFVAPVDASLERVAGLHQFNRYCAELDHRPGPAPIPPGYRLLDDDTLSRLRAINRFDPWVDDPGKALASDRAWADAIQEVSVLLSPERSVDDVIRYLASPPQWVVPAWGIRDPALGAPGRAVLPDKLACFFDARFPEDKMRKAIELRLLAQPDLAEGICIGLMLSGWDLRNTDTSAWLPLCRRQLHRWDVDVARGADPEALPVNLEWSDDLVSLAAPVASTPKVPATTLVKGGTAVALTTLKDVLQGRQEALRGGPEVWRFDAIAWIRAFLGNGHWANKGIRNEVATLVAEVLLGLNEPKLLRHLIAAHEHWSVYVSEARQVEPVADLAPWPSERCALTLSLRTSLGTEAIEKMTSLVKSVSSSRLVVWIAMDAPVDAQFWAAVRTWVMAAPGLGLGLSCNGGWVPSTKDWALLAEFLAELPAASLGEICLDALQDVPANVEDALLTAIDRCGVHSLSVADVSEPFAQKVLPRRTWRRLWVVPSEAMVRMFQQVDVRAHTLRLNRRVDDVWQNAVALVRRCEALSALEFDAKSVNVLALVQLLQEKPSVRAVYTGLDMRSLQDARGALSLMKQNTSVLHFREKTGVAVQRGQILLDPRSWRDIFKVVNGNRLQRRDAFARGAGRGAGIFGLPREVLEHIGRFLDFNSARALAATGRDAFAASRVGREAEITALAEMLKPDISLQDFSSALRARFQKGHLLGPAPLKTTGPPSVVGKVFTLQGAGLPDTVLEQVIDRRLSDLIVTVDQKTHLLREADIGHAWELLEAATWIGAIPPHAWLEKGVGIQVPSAVADGIA